MPTEDVTARIDRLVDEAAEFINTHRTKLREATGDRPWGSERLSPEEKLARFASMWADPLSWAEALEHERGVYSLPPEAAPKRLIKEALELSRKLREEGLVVSEVFPGVAAGVLAGG